jgi:probable phosphoglycerate mutase
MYVYLVRHGQSLSRTGLNHLQGQEVVLSSKGVMEAKNAVYLLENKNISSVLASPMARARQTAEIISERLGLSITFDKRLAEHAPSRTLTGPAFKEAKARTRRDQNYVPENGESFNQSAERFISVLREVLANDVNCVVVSHALVIQNALVKLFSLSEFPHLDTGSVTIISHENGMWKLVSINQRISWLSKFLRTFKKKN